MDGWTDRQTDRRTDSIAVAKLLFRVKNYMCSFSMFINYSADSSHKYTETQLINCFVLSCRQIKISSFFKETDDSDDFRCMLSVISTNNV